MENYLWIGYRGKIIYSDVVIWNTGKDFIQTEQLQQGLYTLRVFQAPQLLGIRRKHSQESRSRGLWKPFKSSDIEYYSFFVIVI